MNTKPRRHHQPANRTTNTRAPTPPHAPLSRTRELQGEHAAAVLAPHDAVGAVAAEQVARPRAGEVRDPQGVLEARVRGAWVDVRRQAQLLELAQALEFGRVDDGDALAREVKVAFFLGFGLRCGAVVL